jgi:hypothetical protein
MNDEVYFYLLLFFLWIASMFYIKLISLDNKLRDIIEELKK